MARTILSIVAASCILVGVALLHFSLTDPSASNWMPVHMPVPPEGRHVTSTFHVDSGGRFQFQIEAAATEPQRHASSPAEVSVEMKATLVISGPRGFKIIRSITEVKSISWGGDTDTFGAFPLIVLPRGGDYEIVVNNGRRMPQFEEQGGVIELVRIAPTGRGMLYVITTVAAYTSLAAACLAIFALGLGPRKPLQQLDTLGTAV
jgi:hypothetical protein